MMKPALLIADEPTTALDATLEVATIELLRELQQDIACSVLFISHHLGVIAELCDDVVVMYAGEVVERDPRGRCFTRRAIPYARRLLSAIRHGNPGARGTCQPFLANPGISGKGRPAASLQPAAINVSMPSTRSRPMLLSRQDMWPGAILAEAR